MKKLLLIAAMGAGLFAYAQAEETKYICSIGDMSDAVFTEEYATEAECKKYCKGISAVCEKTGAKTSVNLTDVD